MGILIFSILLIFIALAVLFTLFPWLEDITMNILWVFGAVEHHVPDGRGGYWKFK